MKKIIFGIISISLIANPFLVYGDELVIEGNGDSSSNEVSVNVKSTTEVTQENSAEIDNNVEVDANTGDNNANENTGDEVSIETGNIEAQIDIENENINQSYVDVDCCQAGLELNINGNGSNSENLINYNSANTTTVNISNIANITNNISGFANTGRNNANENSGDVSISTGSIYVTDTIENIGINVHQVSASSGRIGNTTVKISGNGDGSTNSVSIIDDNNVDINVDNSATIVNNSNWDLNTGENNANGNAGDVKIVTGDIYYESTITNGPINFGWVDVSCCGGLGGPIDPINPVDPTPPVKPPVGGNGGSSGGGGGSSDNGSGSAGGAGAVLPVTGPLNLILLLIANIVMFFMGWYLRLRSGNSPNFALN